MNHQKAFIFDLNGTMIDDMKFHEIAWYSVVHDDLKAPVTHEEMKKQMYGKNEEVLTRIFGENYFTTEEMKKISLEKEKRYQAAYKPYLKLITGLPEFLEQAMQHNIPMAIGTAAIPFNINFVLNHLNLHHYFKAIVSADDVTVSKPHPQTYLLAAEKLGVPPKNCIVFEDAPKGIEAAQNANMKSVAILTMYAKEYFAAYSNILFCIEDYTNPQLKKLLE